MVDNGIPMHPLVVELLGEIEREPGGLHLRTTRMRYWMGVVAGHEDKSDIAVQLVVLAMRFRKLRAERATWQMALLAASIVGESCARRLLESQGLPAAHAQRLMSQAQGASSPLADGLAAPPKKTGR